MSTGVPVHHYTCSVYLFLFGITSTINFQLIYWCTYTQIYPKIKLPVCLHASLLSNHKDLPVTSTTCVHAHRSTLSLPLFHSDKPFVLTFLSPVVLNIRRFTFSSINRSICVFHLALHAHLSVNSSAGLRTDRPTGKWIYLIILMQLDI